MATTVGAIIVAVRAEVEDFVRGCRVASDNAERFRDRTDKLGNSFTTAAGAATKFVGGLGGLGGAAALIGGVAQSATVAAGALLVVPAAGIAAAGAIATLKIATAGFADAVTAADPKAFAEATKDMAPPAVAAAVAVRALVDGPIRDLKREVQGNFFTGFAQDVTALGGTYLPIMRTQLGGIATEYGLMRRDAVQALLQPDAVRATNQVLGDTRGILGDMRPALANVLAGILDIAGQGSTEFRGLGQSITDATTRFRIWADQAAASGRITELIREGKEEFADYGTVAGNVGEIIGAIFEGLSQGSGDFSQSLVQSTQALEDFFESAEGQEALQALGETLSVTAEVTRDVFLAAVKQIGPIIVASAPAIQEFAQVLGNILVNAIQTVGPLIQSFGQFLSDNSGIISVAVPLLGALLGGFLALRAITGVIGIVNGIAASFGLLTTFIGPAGFIIVGLAAAAAAVGAFALANGDSATKVQEHAQKVQVLSGTMDEFTGKATLATRETIAQELATRTLSDGTTTLRDALDQVGIGWQEYAAAASGNEEALQKVNRALLDQGIAFVENEANLGRYGKVVADAKVPTEVLALAMIGNEEAVKSLTTEYGINAGVVETFIGQLRAQNPELTEVGQNLGAYTAAVRDAGDAARASAEATRDFGDSLNAIKSGLAGLAQGQEPLPLMVQSFRDLAASAKESAAQAAENAFAYGGVAAGADAATKSMQQSRDEFIRTATEAGLSAEKANELATQIGLIPATAATEFTTNASELRGELIGIKAQFDAFPKAKDITVNALTDEARIELELMGFTIENLPNGQFKIIPDSAEARADLTNLVNTANTSVGTVQIDGDAEPAVAGIQRVITLADGSKGTVTIDGNGNPATVVLDGVKYRIDATTGILTIDGDAKPGDAKRAGLKLSIDNTTGTVKVAASTASADGTLGAFYAKWNGRTINLAVSTAGRLAGGGVVGYGAAGGMVVPGYGPGRDTFGPVWLSPGEAVLVPELAQRIGYGNILKANYRFSNRPGSVLPGPFNFASPTGMAGGGLAGRDYLETGGLRATGSGGTLISVPPPAVNVGVYVDGEEFRGMVRTEITSDQRATARRVRAGTGVSF